MILPACSLFSDAISSEHHRPPQPTEEDLNDLDILIRILQFYDIEIRICDFCGCTPVHRDKLFLAYLDIVFRIGALELDGDN